MSSNKVYNVSELLGSRIKPTNERFGMWMLLENLEDNNLITDIGNINYTLEEELLSKVNLKPLTPLTNLFCDNIMVAKITDISDCEEGKKIVKKEICGAFNSYLRRQFSAFVSARHGVKAKLPFLLNSERAMAERTRNNLGKDVLDNIAKKFKNPIIIPYKIELADVHLETLLQEIPDILSDLQAHDYYLMDFDITQDFVGIFNKREMCDYLINNHNFRYQGNEYKKDCNTILNNIKTASIDCLTWMTPNDARVKIYNKFVCQLTSPGVNKQIGNHIVDFVNCPDSRLKQTFMSPLAKDHGITRLEVTIYNNYTNNPLKHCVSFLEKNKLYLQDAPFYSVSIPKMWIKLTENLYNSSCLVFNNLLQYVYWGNTNTRKLTGIQVTLPDDPDQRQKLITYSISAFSFNYLPVNYIEVVEDPTHKENVEITHKCYIKSGETFFSKSTAVFSTLHKDINLENCGLVQTKNVIPQVLRKRSNVNRMVLPCTIKEIVPLSTIYLACAKKRRLELEEVDIKRRKLEFLEKTISVQEEHKELHAKEKMVRETKDRLTKYFKQPWKNLDTHGDYKVSAFTVNTRTKYPIVGILAEKDGDKCVYFFKGRHKLGFIDVYNSRNNLIKEGFLITSYNEQEDLIYLATEEAFITFSTNGVDTINSHSFPKIENLKLLSNVWTNPDGVPYNQEDIYKMPAILITPIEGRVVPGQCTRLEEIEKGTELIVSRIKAINYRNKIRYILQFENLDKLFLSNYWLQKEIKELNMDLNYKFKVKFDKLKTTPNKMKERLVFCV